MIIVYFFEIVDWETGAVVSTSYEYPNLSEDYGPESYDYYVREVSNVWDSSRRNR